MKRTLSAILPLLAASLFSVSPAFAQTHQHVAIVYCGIDKNNDVRVVAADIDLMGGAASAGKRWRSCSQVLHEVMLNGYRISYSDVVDQQSKSKEEADVWGYTVFVLTKEEAAHK
ncbi:MAG: hypothetical protein K0M48_08840 [Thiobacillus sp.]|nr:hypothetical protein [Thiobacillus sp.]